MTGRPRVRCSLGCGARASTRTPVSLAWRDELASALAAPHAEDAAQLVLMAVAALRGEDERMRAVVVWWHGVPDALRARSSSAAPGRPGSPMRARV